MDRVSEWATDWAIQLDGVEAGFASSLVVVNRTGSLESLPIRSG